MNSFEGNAEIRLGEGLWVNDLAIALLLLLFVSFAYIFHRHYGLFCRMLKDAFFVKKRQNLFEEFTGDDSFFRRFMIFQALMLCSLFVFVLCYRLGYFVIFNWWNLLILPLIFLTVFLLFYGLKQVFYHLIGWIFTNEEPFSLWKTSYQANIGLWGVSLYIPVVLLLFVDINSIWALICFILFYIGSRFVIIYKTIRIFSLKKDGFFYLCLYLCGQEILPLFFLYVGMDYLYNFIEMNTLWR
ncbi:DUF4271 domain-containing protein [Parabacteroides sp. OttesenSCG-928-G07]|nr:DUF4271 domain-containing protein [Parabacteroides sp. OttesenSCG-928-G07]